MLKIFTKNSGRQQRKIKILHIAEGFTGGVKTYLCNVLVELVKKGFDVSLVCSLNRKCPDWQDKIEKLKLAGVKIHIIKMSRGINPVSDFISFLFIVRILVRGRYDIVHTHCSKAGAIGRTAAFAAGCRYIFHSPHCFSFLRCGGKTKRKIYFAIERLLGFITTKIIAVSPSEKNIAVSRNIVSRHRCRYIPNALPIKIAKSSLSKTDLGISQNTRVVLTACRMVEYKGIIRLIKSIKSINHRDVIFIIAGVGEIFDATQNFIRQNNLESKVKMLGFVRDMNSLYNICDLFVLCSDAEAQPYVILEAMRASKAIVATDVEGNRDIIENFKTGRLVNTDSADIAEVIDELLNDDAQRSRLSKNGYEYFRQTHNLKNQIEQLSQVYISSVQPAKKFYESNCYTTI